ncbi:hypothetical protein HOF56_00485 [Candidatus Peribacteria bacterium]|jgi:uncharacterized membrane protein YvlD (DUF360 family)|nr:hypothetical protein [Candidatus Peribacteria bacterium]MBT4020892.1 hypothetical protein [Candidatus Peribacteria bacterium]MBT4240978.1 hypothetical protein [Candidatus Peribacteria bacterium]MBT4473891.1 hypothetical protein [Candidatus Peribacteria bacterium]
MSSEKHTHHIIRIIVRLVLNIGLVIFFLNYFGSFFLLEGGTKAIVLVGIVFAFVNWIVAPILRVISLPIKFFAWIIAFVLVNVITMWFAVWFVDALAVEGISLAIDGGIIGWLTMSVILGFCNWLVKIILK